MLNVLLLLGAQVVYSFSDLWKKKVLAEAGGVSWRLVTNPAFLLATAVPVVGFILYITALNRMDLSKVAIVFSAFGVVMFVAVGVLFRHETLSTYDVLGILAAIVAIVLVNIK